MIEERGPVLSTYADTSFFVSLYLLTVTLRRRSSAWPPSRRSGSLPSTLRSGLMPSRSMFFARRFRYTRHGRPTNNGERDQASGVWLEADLARISLKTCTELARRHGPKLEFVLWIAFTSPLPSNSEPRPSGRLTNDKRSWPGSRPANILTLAATAAARLSAEQVPHARSRSA